MTDIKWVLAATLGLGVGLHPSQAEACAPSYWNYDLTSLPACVDVEGEADSAGWTDDTALFADGIALSNGCEHTLSFTVVRPDDAEAPAPIPPGETGFILWDDHMHVSTAMTWHLADDSGPLTFDVSVNPCGSVGSGGCSVVGPTGLPAVGGLVVFGLWGLGRRRRS